jgi:hypothetical protein
LIFISLILSRGLVPTLLPFSLFSVLGLFNHAYLIKPSFLLIFPFLKSIIAPLRSFHRNKSFSYPTCREYFLGIFPKSTMEKSTNSSVVPEPRYRCSTPTIFLSKYIAKYPDVAIDEMVSLNREFKTIDALELFQADLNWCIRMFSLRFPFYISSQTKLQDF